MNRHQARLQEKQIGFQRILSAPQRGGAFGVALPGAPAGDLCTYNSNRGVPRLRFIQDVNEGIVVLRFLEDRIAIISTIERVVKNPLSSLGE
jgi:hypothetical protein